MRSYLVIHELRNKKKDYSGFYKAIASYGKSEHIKIFENTWMVLTDHSAKNVHEYLSRFIDKDKDGLMVIRPVREATWEHIESPDQWLIDNLGII